MESPEENFELTAEQQDTAGVLERLLGGTIADRYVDFCKLATGALSLRASSPLAGHALRELESMLRQALEVPMDAKAPSTADDQEKIRVARKNLREAGFDDHAVDRAAHALEPRLNHKDQIRKIVSRLGLSPDSDIAEAWLLISEAHSKAHQRSFLRSPAVDDDFRARWQRPFDMVVRGVVIALEGRYSALMRRAEQLAAMKNVGEAVKLFEKEIPGALPLQWHFYENLTSEAWLPHLVRRNLIGEPLSRTYQGKAAPWLREWPAGRYLLMMAKSPNLATRRLVAQAIRDVASSQHPDVYQNALQIIAELPPKEAAALSDIAIGWLQPGSEFLGMQAPQQLVKCLAEGGQQDAALNVARVLLQLFEQNGNIGSLYTHLMYEHHLPGITVILTGAFGEAALKLFCDLLRQAAVLTGKVSDKAELDISHYSSRPIADDSMAQQDIYDALISAVRRSAEITLQADPRRMQGIIAIFESYPQKIFMRIALHVLAKKPDVASELAEKYLRNPDLIDGHWCAEEYAELAIAWFPSLGVARQQAVLDVVDAVPDRYRTGWEQRFMERYNRSPSAEDLRRYEVTAVRDILWRWRTVLSPERQEAIANAAAEFGDPDAWKVPFWGQGEASPLTSADLAAQSVEATFAFITAWQPGGEPQKQTLTALAFELRKATEQDPAKYTEASDRVASLRPIFVRHIFEGLANACKHKRSFRWNNVLRSIEIVFSRMHDAIDADTIFEGDDPDWLWTCAAACDLLKSGLQQGEQSIALENAAVIEELVFQLFRAAPRTPKRDDFEERFQQYPYFAAMSTLRGAAIELCILMVFWLSKQTESSIALEPRAALQKLPAVRQVLEDELADISSMGRIPHAIIGRYLSWLFYFGEDWVALHIDSIFPETDKALRDAAWFAHLDHDLRPIRELMPQFHPLYMEEIDRLADRKSYRASEIRQKNLTDRLLVLYLWESLPNDLLEAFWQAAPSVLLRHAIWFLGTHLGLSPDQFPGDLRARVRAYWEARLSAAKNSSTPDAFREELGMIGQWCNRNENDADWLLNQLLEMLQAGFVPGSGYSVMLWLAKLSQTHIDRVMEILAAYFTCPWTRIRDSMLQKNAIRTILEAGCTKGTPQTVVRAEEIVSRLATFGETGYLDLVGAPVA